MRNTIKVLGLFIVLMFVYPKLAFATGLSCAQLVQNSGKHILGDLGVHLQIQAVRQCEGSCYFESVVSPLEAKLSVHFGKPVTVSRPYLFANLLMLRIAVLASGGKGIISFQNSKNGISDIVSKGSVMLMSALINNSGLRIMGPKSQSYIYKENAVMKELYNTIGQRIHDLLRSRQQKRFKNKEDAETDASSALKEAISTFMPELKKILEEANLNTTDQISNIKIKSKSTGLEFETGDHLSSASEASIVETLSRGEELTLNYFHISSYTRRIDGHDGFLLLPENPLAKSEAEKNRIGGAHGVALVDVIKDRKGRVEYLVIRNSWGGKEKAIRVTITLASNI